MLEEGRLKATVVLPRVAGPAVEIVGRLLGRGQRPADVVMFPSASFPELDRLPGTA